MIDPLLAAAAYLGLLIAGTIFGGAFVFCCLPKELYQLGCRLTTPEKGKPRTEPLHTIRMKVKVKKKK